MPGMGKTSKGINYDIIRPDKQSGGKYNKGGRVGKQLGGAQLGGAQLGGAQLGGAQLGGAQLGGAQLGGAEGNTRPITGTQRFDQPGMGMRGGLMYNKGGRVGLKKGTKKTYQERLEPSGNSFKDAFSSAKKAGKKEFTWKGRDYTTVTKEERTASFKKETRREKYKRKTSQGKQGGLTEFEGAFKTAKKRFGPNYDFTHKGKKFKSDVKGDKPRREGYDTQVMASKGGKIK
jgi:hypothetical protein